MRLLLTDVDGVLTEGRLFHFIDTEGELVEFKALHSQDGLGLLWLAERGIATGIISGRKSAGMAARAEMLKMRFIVQGTLAKREAFERILSEAGLRPSEAAFVGDDIPDIPVMRRVGLAVAVADARPEVKAAAHWVTRRPGGRGAMREVCELILKAQGHWRSVLSQYD